jgi:uncharacterized membrane protein YfcA
MSPAFYLIVLLVGLLIGLSKGGMGAVLVVLTTPLLSLVMPVQSAISLALPLLLIADGFALWVFWRKWDLYYVRLMLIPGAVGVAIGSIILALLPDFTLRRILGLFTLVFILYRLFASRLTALTYRSRTWHGYAAGAASGLGSALANTGAPPFTAYMLLQRVPPLAFAGTTTLFFAIINALKLPGLLVTGIFDFEQFLATLWVLPTIPLGVFLGRWLIARINPVTFERLLLVLLTLATALLLLR